MTKGYKKGKINPMEKKDSTPWIIKKGTPKHDEIVKKLAELGEIREKLAYEKANEVLKQMNEDLNKQG